MNWSLVLLAGIFYTCHAFMDGNGSGEGSGEEETCLTEPSKFLKAAGHIKMGCFKRNKKIFRKLLVNYRNGKGTQLDWSDFQGSLKKLACECGQKAAALGYRYFNIQFYGECYGAHYVNERKLKKSKHCLNNYTSGCYGDNIPSDETEICAGKANAGFIYKV